MSDNEEADQQQVNPEEEAPVAEPEDPRTTIKPETIVEGLSKVQRTAGKLDWTDLGRRQLVCFHGSEPAGEGGLRAEHTSATLRALAKLELKQE